MSSRTRRYKMVRPGLGVYRELPILRGPYPIDRAPTTRLSIVLISSQLVASLQSIARAAVRQPSRRNDLQV